MDSSQEMPAAVAKKQIPDDAVQHVCKWALPTAGCAASYAIAYGVSHYLVPCGQSSFLPCDQPTDADPAEETTLWIGMLCCATIEAAAAMLALRLSCHRRLVRRAVAYLALALTFVIHCMYGVAVAARLFLVDDPQDLFITIFCTVAFVYFVAGDIRSFLALLGVGGEE